MKELTYSINTLESNGKYSIFSPELSLFVKTEQIESSYKEFSKLLKAKEELYKEIGIELTPIKITPRKFHGLSAFTKKWSALFLVLLLIVATFILSINILFTQVFNHRYSRLERKVLETITPTEIKQKKRLIRFQEKMKSLSPYIRETKKLLNTNKKASND